ncbi:uncharacterized protein LOC115243148 [Formica exsecta]|uniref:uncharacterized protein LOC115243148 n=1 Tax=Formica exsecta TaxID=72781 RepID=UPI001143EB62|nr:uncharacterized protein LOC115243148 [Formica exsecta]
MYKAMGQQHPADDRSTLAERNRENDAGSAKKARMDSVQGYDWTSRRDVAIGRSLRILGRCYPLTKTAYKHLEVGVNVSRPSYVEVVLGNCHGKEISFAPDVWKELLDLRSVLTSYFQRDEREEMRPPAPIYIGQLTLRFGKLNNLRILRLETPKDRLVASRSTVLNILNLEHCINRIITTLSGLTGYIDNKLTRFLDIAADVYDRTLIPTAIRDSKNFDRNDIIDCELQALLFGES